jgi:hypothetical protein
MLTLKLQQKSNHVCVNVVARGWSLILVEKDQQSEEQSLNEKQENNKMIMIIIIKLLPPRPWPPNPKPICIPPFHADYCDARYCMLVYRRRCY